MARIAAVSFALKPGCHVFLFETVTKFHPATLPSLENCVMHKQSMTKQKAEGRHHEPEVMPTKKLQKAPSQPTLNSLPRPTSATELSLSESPPFRA